MGWEWGSHLLQGRVPAPVTPLGQEWGVSPPLEGCPGRAAPAGVGRGVQLPPTPSAPGSGSQAGSGRGGPPRAAPERPGGNSGPGPRALGGKGGERGPLSNPLHPSPSPISGPHLAGPRSSTALPAATPPPQLFSDTCWGAKTGSGHPKCHSRPFGQLMHPSQCPHHPRVPAGLRGTAHCGI